MRRMLTISGNHEGEDSEEMDSSVRVQAGSIQRSEEHLRQMADPGGGKRRTP